MAKKQNTQPAAAAKQTEKPIAAVPVSVKQSTPFNYKDINAWLTEFTGQAIIVALLSFVLYCNTFNHEFAHDDGIVIVKNEYVLEGFAGIPGILTKDAYDSYYRQLNTTNQLDGGRYRPLSIVTFAIEQQLLGAVAQKDVDSVLKQTISYGVSGPTQKKLVSNMHVRHVFNVLWYMLSVVVLLYFLRYIVFSKYPVIAFIAAVLFAVHPVHTEVVANVKSRDEIMSLLFMCLTFIYSFKYEENKEKVWTLAAAMLSFLFAFLSKEYAITMVALLPLAFYIFRGYSVYKSLSTVLPYLVVVTVYLAIRLNAIAPAVEDTEGVSAAAGAVIKIFPLLGILGIGYALYAYTRLPKDTKMDSQALFGNVLSFAPYFVIAAIYLFQRVQAIPPVAASASQEVLNNPYLYAEGSQKLATEISSSMYYLKLLVFPHPLSADYSYNQIPYKDFSHPLVWLSLLVHLGMTAIMFLFLPKRKFNDSVAVSSFQVDGKSLIAFAIAFYLVHLLLVCNIVFDIGATLGERLIYHSSVGFVIVVAWLLYKGFEKIQPVATAQKGLAALMVVIVALMGFKTFDRNQYWKNDSTLFGQDIKTVPNSVLVNANVAASYITLADYAPDKAGKDKYLHDAITILDHTLSIHRKFVAAFLNRGIAWYKLGDIDKAKANIDTVKTLYPTYPTLPGMYKLLCEYYLKLGWEEHGKKGDYAGAIEVYRKGLEIDPNSIDLWYNMGGAYYTNKQFQEAVAAFSKASQLDPTNQQTQKGLNAAMAQLNQMQGQPAKK